MSRVEGAASGKSEALALELERLRAEHERLRLEHEHLLEAQQLGDNAHSEFVEAYDCAPCLSSRSIVRAAFAMSIVRGPSCRASSGHPGARALRTFVAPDDRRALAQHLATARSTNEHACDLRFARVDGVSLPARLWTRVSSEDGGSLQIAILDLRDREPALEEMRRLVESERAARESSIAKDKFIAVLSHELRTPLTPVLAASSLMVARKSTAPDIAAVFEMIQRNVLMETRLIDDLLCDSYRPRADARSTEAHDLHQVVREATEILGEELAKKRQSIHVDSVPRHWANADPIRMQQVFLNLLRNAIKFTPEGGDVYLRSWNAGARLTIEVEDNGIGLAPEALARLFEPFEQADDSWSNRGAGGGLGLGLAISKGLVDLHHGNLFAGSGGRNQGARFAVQLHTVAAELAPAAVEEKAAGFVMPDPAEARAAGQRLRILLVDNRPGSRGDVRVDEGNGV